jgi:hypothetical protein
MNSSASFNNNQGLQIDRNEFLNTYGNAGLIYFEVISWACQQLLKETTRTIVLLL